MRLLVGIGLALASAGCTMAGSDPAGSGAMLDPSPPLPAATGTCALNLTAPLNYAYGFNAGDPAPAECNLATSPGNQFYIQSPNAVLDPALGVTYPATATAGTTITFVGDNSVDTAMRFQFGVKGQGCGVWTGTATIVSVRPNTNITFDLTCPSDSGWALSGQSLRGSFTSSL